MQQIIYKRVTFFLGPAFVAAIAYVDPGNVAANLTSGAKYGYLLLWVLIIANIFAAIVQYQSAKLGIITGKTLPEILRIKLKPTSRILYWLQAELVAIATDVAEIFGGAIALKLIFGLSLPVSGIIICIMSMLLLSIQNRKSQRSFEMLIIFFLFLTTFGFLYGLFLYPPNFSEIIYGLKPSFIDKESVLIASSMVGATIMPHAIYLHSALSKAKHPFMVKNKKDKFSTFVKTTKLDVILALTVAGFVNIGMLVLAASSLRGVYNTDSIEEAYVAISHNLSNSIAIIFAIGLLASGLASTSVGCYASDVITKGLLNLKISLMTRRVISIIPALLMLILGINPTWGLIFSQIVLSFGIPFALIPLIQLTSNSNIMGHYKDGICLRIFSYVSVTLIVFLNLLLIIISIVRI